MMKARVALAVSLVAVLVGAGLTSVQAMPTAPAPRAASAPSVMPSLYGGMPGKKLDRTLISALKSKDHTAAVKKIRINPLQNFNNLINKNFLFFKV